MLPDISPFTSLRTNRPGGKHRYAVEIWGEMDELLLVSISANRSTQKNPGGKSRASYPPWRTADFPFPHHISLQGHRHGIPQTQGLKRQMFIFSVLGARSPRSRFWLPLFLVSTLFPACTWPSPCSVLTWSFLGVYAQREGVRSLAVAFLHGYQSSCVT